MIARRVRAVALIAVSGVAVAAGCLWYGLHGSSAALYQRGLAALERGDHVEVARLAGSLSHKGENDRAHLLRGRLLFRDAEEHRETAARLARLEVSERVLRFLARQAADGSADFGFAFRVHDLGTTAFVAKFRPSFARFVQAQERADIGFARAEAELASVGLETPLGVEAAPLLGQCALQRGDLKTAIEAFRRAAQQQPEDSDIQRALADAYYELGNVEQAIAHARAFADLEPDDGYGYRLIAGICRTYRRFGEARRAYRQALDRQLDFSVRVRVLHEFAEMLIEDLADFDEAVKVLDRFPETHARRPEVLALRSECLWSKGKREEARKLTDSALRADADLFRALSLRGRIFLEEDEPADALPLLQRAAIFAPDDFRVHDQLARAYRQLGQPAQAAGHDRRRQELVEARTRLTVLSKKAMDHPWDGEVRFEIAAIYLRMDRRQEARQWLRAVLACEPGHAAARQALRKLDGVED